MNIYKKYINEALADSALKWVLQNSENPKPELEPEFDLMDNKRRLAKKIRKISWTDPDFWNQWMNKSGIKKLAAIHLQDPVLIKHAAFIKRKVDESYIPLHQDVVLWEKPYLSATTFWIALTVCNRENGGMFYYPDDSVIFKHELDLNYPMFKCIAKDKTINPDLECSLIQDFEAQPGDVAVWSAGTPHGSHTNTSSVLRVGMPLVFIEKSEFNGTC